MRIGVGAFVTLLFPVLEPLQESKVFLPRS
jgi:hypothetical protein